ncbi:uncharacterized protein [Antedon mediterranea]|uniref:uncharacterized protein n=1 Tax=Antedon mediterranea TaxID=105859 RepID=UPI003AF4850E
MSSIKVDEQKSLSQTKCIAENVFEAEHSLPTEKPHVYSQAENFCLKTKIFEAIEELKMRREMHAEAEEKVQQLLQANLNLQKMVDAEKKLNLIQVDTHNLQLTDLKKIFNDELLSIKEDKEKHVQLAGTAEKEVLKLRDEIRAMLLNKYSLEKRVQELERAINYQDTARTDHNSQLVDLEHKCKQINVQRSALEDMFEQFQKNVKSACEFNRKLEYISNHRQCQVNELQSKLEQQHDDLMEARAKLEARPSPGTELSHLKTQEDIFHKELQAKDKLCDQLLKHVEEIRMDRTKTLSSLSEAHSLIDHYVKEKEVNDVVEVKYQHLLNDHEVLKDSWEEKNKLCQSLQQLFEEKETHWLKKKEELTDTLSTYQKKCDDLTKSSDKLEELKEYYCRMYEDSQLNSHTLQESITKSNTCSNVMLSTTSQTTQTHEFEASVDVFDDFHQNKDAENAEQIKNVQSESDSGIKQVNMKSLSDIPCLIDRIQNKNPNLASYYNSTIDDNSESSVKVMVSAKAEDIVDLGSCKMKENVRPTTKPVDFCQNEQNIETLTLDKTISKENDKNKDQHSQPAISITEPFETDEVASLSEMSPEFEVSKDIGNYMTKLTLNDPSTNDVSLLLKPYKPKTLQTIIKPIDVPNIISNRTSHRSVPDSASTTGLLQPEPYMQFQANPVVGIPNAGKINQTSVLDSANTIRLPETHRLKTLQTSPVTYTSESGQKSDLNSASTILTETCTLGGLQKSPVIPRVVGSSHRSVSDLDKEIRCHVTETSLSGSPKLPTKSNIPSGDEKVRRQMVISQCRPTDTTFKRKLFSNHSIKSKIQALDKIQTVQTSECELKTDLVFSCKIARSDLEHISQQWEEEKQSQKQCNQRTPFDDKDGNNYTPTNQSYEEEKESQTHLSTAVNQGIALQEEISKHSQGKDSQKITQNQHQQTCQIVDLKRINTFPVDFPIEEKKVKLQPIVVADESNLRMISTQQVSVCSQQQLFSDDDDEELNNDIANKIQHIISSPTTE